MDSCDGMIVFINLCGMVILIEAQAIQMICSIGSGAFGHVHKAVWCGTIVAAKVVNTTGNEQVIENELSVNR